MTEHFTLAEFTRSQLAARHGIDNSLPSVLLEAAEATLEMAERVRWWLGHPVLITSGYRSLEVNRLLGSKDTSDHTQALAIDFVCPSYGTPLKVAHRLLAGIEQNRVLGVGQLIHEFGSWVHISRRAPAKQVNRIITIDRQGVRPGILEAR